jgi:dTDP-4-dehydrorhamnose 3,5-epimerase
VLLIAPKVFGDARGFLLEVSQRERYAAQGIGPDFSVELWSRSAKNTVRGLHFQEPKPQGKLVFVTRGAVFDVAVDIRKGSPNFGKWFGAELTEENKHQLWIPPGFAHGFCVLSDFVDMHYRCVGAYAKETEHVVAWNDPDIGIAWPLNGEPLLSPRDSGAPHLKEAPVLPTHRPSVL